ncbi:unnamed protein product [Rhizoctonia solani]|uniref:Uncharacterized protein n=1 Tax=Rhizoctonia solani TaxID=456999 RepID=A0A8H3A8S4_9AGAM|nr:unnamed protein product [Rhizoctonia solani]
MAHAVDSRPRFNSYPTPINTNYPPSSSKPYYTYAAATPTTTPTKSSSPYHYRQASNSSQTRLPQVPVAQSSSSRPVPRTSTSIPNPRTASSSVPPPASRSNTLPASSEHYSHSRKNSTSRTQLPTADAYRAAKREDDRYASARVQQQQQYADAQAKQARLIAERDATLKRMEDRQRKAQAQSWFEETQRLAAEAARKQEEDRRRAEEDRRRAEEKLRRAAQVQAEKEREKHARSQERGHERGRSQTHNPAAAPADKKWYSFLRDKSRDARRKDERGSDRDQRPERERAKSEGRAREAVEARERVDKDRARNANSPSSVASNWAAYEKACAELMDSKPSKGKNLTFYDIPWPILGQANAFQDLTNASIAAFLLSPHHSRDKSPKARLRAAILIWHPDKFAQKVLPHVAESHRQAVLAAVNVVARIVTELISSN